MRVDEHAERRALNGDQRVDVSGHLRLLATSRRIAGFATGERLLLVADLDNDALHIMTTRTLSRFVNLDQTQVARGARQDG